MARTPTGNAKGRPRKPTALRLLDGSAKVHPERLNQNEPLPPQPASSEPPRQLSPPAREIWDRVAPVLRASRILTVADEEQLAQFCEAAVGVRATMSRWMREEDELRRGQARSAPSGQLSGVRAWRISAAQCLALANQLGLTPAARARLLGPDYETPSADDLLSG